MLIHMLIKVAQSSKNCEHAQSKEFLDDLHRLIIKWILLASLPGSFLSSYEFSSMIIFGVIYFLLFLIWIFVII